MTHSDIRRIFYDFFQKRHHHRVISSPLIPARDPSLLFTNAGMNPFKDVFLRKEAREYNRAVSIQKCMRVSGKHNDFDEVGKTEYHHTFFEMMGNFSFGDYFKPEAIAYAWELLTGPYGFDPEALWVSVFLEDDEAQRIWETEIGVPAGKIARLDEKSNFWQMGDTGPCGPCSEIHFDRGSDHGPPEIHDGNPRFVEIWNLVFMQYFRDESGHLNPLPAPSIDTGMGMERLTSLLQGVLSNYDTDLFVPIIEYTAELTGVSPDDADRAVDLKVVADHVRALTFLIADGVMPANDGRGYVLRRLLRRAAKHGRSLGFADPFLHRVSGRVIDIMTDTYPELAYQREFVAQVILSEEERFDRTLLHGLRRFEDILREAETSQTGKIPGRDLFKLSDTHGFPLDFAIDLANERNVAVDLAGFEKELNKQRERSRTDLSTKRATDEAAYPGIESLQSEFTGYSLRRDEGRITAMFAMEDGRNRAVRVEKAEPGQKVMLVFDRTPFYAESGGQVGDRGRASNQELYLEIEDTQKAPPPSTAILHHAVVRTGCPGIGSRLELSVDEHHRRQTAVHHSATHLLHYALREVLGLHVKQSGSYVGPDKLRFDFTHFQAVSDSEIEKIEGVINRKIRENLPVRAEHQGYEEAVQLGAIALFEEKYGDRVRVVSMGDVSMELCGGTHLAATGEIGCCKIISESSISAGSRRIEALAGQACFDHIQSRFNILTDLQRHFQQPADRILPFLQQMEQTLREKEKALKERRIQARPGMDLQRIMEETVTIGDVRTVVEFIEDADRSRMGAIADEIKEKTGGISVLMTNINGKSAITCSIAPSLTGRVTAKELIREIAGLVDGNGGGRAEFAQAGGNPIGDIPALKEDIRCIIERHLT